MLDPAHKRPGAVAVRLVSLFGEKARPLIEEQLGRCADQPRLVERWQAIADSVTTLMEADAHMQIALELLDILDDKRAVCHLDAAIVAVGARSGDEEQHQIDRYDRTASQRHYRAKADRHLTLAGEQTDLAKKGLHLDISTLR